MSSMRQLLSIACNRFFRWKGTIAIFLMLCFLLVVKLDGLQSLVDDWFTESLPRSLSGNTLELDTKKTFSSMQKRNLALTDPNEQAARRRTVLEGCRNINNSDWLDKWPRMKTLPTFTNEPLIDRKKKLFYCPAGKVMSTFLTRWMLAMKKSGPMTSPFTVRIQDANREYVDTLQIMKSDESRMRFVESSLKVVFGRNPYARIFSAYIEKLFRPNSHYWKEWGIKALALSKAKVQRCGSKVNFQQFVRFAVTPEALLDKHLRPVASECQMCQMYYDVIGNVETVVPDLQYISDKIDVSSQFQRKKNFKRDLRVDTLKEVLHRVLKEKHILKSCISMDEMGRRIWRELEIRGVKDSSIEYPFKTGEIDSLTEKQLLSTCTKFVLASTDHAKLKRQKKQAMEELYSTLTSSDLDLLFKAFADDFNLFGYPHKPAFLYNDSYRAGIKSTNVLDWNTHWHLP